MKLMERNDVSRLDKRKNLRHDPSGARGYIYIIVIKVTAA